MKKDELTSISTSPAWRVVGPYGWSIPMDPILNWPSWPFCCNTCNCNNNNYFYLTTPKKTKKLLTK